MISRRSIRVKVMQCLYAVESETGDLKPEQAAALLDKYLAQTGTLFAFTIYLVTEIARYAETDSINRASKHLPSQEDLNVNTKIAGNTLLWKILESSSFKTAIKNGHFQQLIDSEKVRKIYLKLVESPLYKTYITEEGRENKTEKELLSFIFTDLIMAEEEVTDYLEELFVQWDDDAEMIYQLVLNFFSKPQACDFQQIAGPDKKKYAVALLKTVMEKKDMTLEMIKPKLKNWDPDRIAVLDMIMIRMGVCELLFFETIPAKVTINEYIDIAKSYSTAQSGHFVNGILDSIHKDLIAEGKLKKVDFKKQA
ncbi:MAG: transcription antitermination factor NusB [Bacteroidota bacterium]